MADMNLRYVAVGALISVPMACLSIACAKEPVLADDSVSTQSYVLHGRVVSGLPAKPAAGAEVDLYGAKDSVRTLQADADGRFAFTLDEDFPWHTRVVARKDGLVSPYLHLNEKAKLRSELVLGKPAFVSGRVEQLDGEPAAGGRVLLAAGHGKTIAMGLIDESGNYRIAGVPPGAYAVHLAHDRYSLTLRTESETKTGPAVNLEVGKPATLNLLVVENAHISGRLEGPEARPVAGQAFEFGTGAWNRPKTLFRTDSDGHFSGYVAPWPAKQHARITHETLGFGTLKLPPLAPGEQIEGLKEQLSGAMRITGVVTGLNDEPVVGVRVGGSPTDRSGHFDTGWRPIGGQGEYHVLEVVPPGMPAPLGPAQNTSLAAQGGEEPVMYKQTKVRVVGQHGEEREITVKLTPMPSRELRGSVLDVRGRPAAGATVLVYQGEALTEQWISELTSALPPEPEPRLKNWRRTPPQGPAFLMARLEADARGQWNSTVFPLPVDPACNGRPPVYPLLHTVAVVSHDGTSAGVARIYFAEEPAAPVDVDMRLETVGGDYMVQIAVLDEDGNPLPGIEWILNCDYGYLESDADGIVAVPRIAVSIDLALKDARYCILDARTMGTFSLAPPPQGDPVRQWADSSSNIRCDGQLPSPRYPVSTEIEWDTNSIRLPFFDTNQGGLTITVSACDT